MEHVSAGRDITIQLPGISEEQYQHLTSELGVTRSLLNTFVKILQQEQVPVEERPKELHEIAQAHKRGELLERQAQRLQVRAVELIQEGKADRALDELREGREILTALFKESPADAKLYALLGYFYKTIAQAFDERGDRKLANRYLSLADSTFQLVKDDIPADAKTAADIANAINGLGNVHHERGNFEKAIENYRLAVMLNPAYAYAWHDLFGAHVALAQRGKVDLAAMRHALQRVKEIGVGLPGLSADYIAQLEAHIHWWEEQASVLDQRGASSMGKKGSPS